MFAANLIAIVVAFAGGILVSGSHVATTPALSLTKPPSSTWFFTMPPSSFTWSTMRPTQKPTKTPTKTPTNTPTKTPTTIASLCTDPDVVMTGHRKQDKTKCLPGYTAYHAGTSCKYAFLDFTWLRRIGKEGLNPFCGIYVGENGNLAFADMDGDGDLDAFVVDDSGKINYFRNNGTRTMPKFSQTAGEGNYFLEAVVGSNGNVVFADLDNDGDLDAVVIDSGSMSEITYYRNEGPELKGELAIKFTKCNEENNPFQVLNTDILNGIKSIKSMAFVDIGGDANLDAIAINKDDEVNCYLNVGKRDSPKFVEIGQDDEYLCASFGGLKFGHVSVADMDGDSDLDVYFGDHNGSIKYFRNDGKISLAEFEKNSEQANPLSTSDSKPDFAHAGYAFPVDIDGDGDMDTFVSNTDGTFLYCNHGNATQASFKKCEDPLKIETYHGNENRRKFLAFGDLDGDGDLDALVGEYSPGIRYFRNDGNKSRPSFTELIGAENPFHGIFEQEVGSAYIPMMTLVDIDKDDALDLFVTRRDRTVTFLQNVGTNTKPKFSRIKGAGEPFTLALRKAGGLSPLAFFDMDGDGDLDAFGDGGNLYFRNDGGVFTQVTNAGNPFFAGNTCVFGKEETKLLSFVDLNGDDHLDAILSTDHCLWSLKNTARNTSFVQFANVDDRAVEKNPFYKVDFGRATQVAFVDVDDDGSLDAFAPSSEGEIVYFRNNNMQEISIRQQKFTRLSAFSGANPLRGFKGEGISPITFADLDGDGDIDAIAGDYWAGYTYLRNDGNSAKANFKAYRGGDENPFKDLKQQGHVSHMILADLDGDGQLDALAMGLIWDDRWRRFVWHKNYFRNIGNTTMPKFDFSSYNKFGQGLPFFNGINGKKIVTFGDLDGDGDLDAFAGAGENAPKTFFRNIGNRTHPNFKEESDINLPSCGWKCFDDVAFADLDNDGDLDVFRVVKKPTQGTPYLKIQYYENQNEAGRLQFRPNVDDNPFREQIFPDESEGTTYLTFADLDGDGDLDLVLTLGDSGTLDFYMNTAVDCATDCSVEGRIKPGLERRGQCAQPFSSTDTHDPSRQLLKLVADQKGISMDEAVGKCFCNQQFTGDSCEQCANQYYGVKCDRRCPKFSFTQLGIGEKAFPNSPKMDDCICDEARGFQRVNNSDSTPGFACLCKPGYEFNGVKKECEPCPLGMYKPLASNSMRCQVCSDILLKGPVTTASIGTHESSQCTCAAPFILAYTLNACICPDNFYMNGQSCNACPEARPFTRNSGALDKSECMPGPGFLLAGNEVHSCRDAGLAGKVQCDNVGTLLESVELVPGHWRISSSSMDIRECVESLHCIPSPGFVIPFEIGNRSRIPWSANQYCAPNHDGVLCTSCVEGFALKSNGCEECTDAAIKRDKVLWKITITLSILVVVVLPAACVAWSGLPANSGSTPCCALSCRNSTPCCAVSCRNSLVGVKDRLSGYFRLAFGFFQVYSQYVALMGLLEKDGALLVSVFANLDFSAALKLIHIGCATTMDFYQRLLIYTLVPLSSWLCIVVILGLLYCSVKSSNFARACGTAAFISLQLLFIIYPGVSATIFRTFVYEEFPQGNHSSYYAVEADYTIAWESPRSQDWRIYAGVMILIYPVGGVVAFAAGVWVHNRWNDVSDSESKTRVSQATKFLVEPFKNNWRYFECYEMVRKITLTSMIVLVHQKSPGGAKVAFIAALVIFRGVLSKATPYKDPLEQFFAECSLLLLMLLGIVSLLPDLVVGVNAGHIYYLTAATGVAELFLLLISTARMLCRKNGQDQKSTNPGNVENKEDQPETSSPDTSSTCFEQTVSMGSDTKIERISPRPDSAMNTKINCEDDCFGKFLDKPCEGDSINDCSFASALHTDVNNVRNDNSSVEYLEHPNETHLDKVKSPRVEDSQAQLSSV